MRFFPVFFLCFLAFPVPLLTQSGDVLYRIDGAHAYAGQGGALASCGDLNGDGISDLLIGGDQYVTYGATSARVISGADGSELFSWTGLTNAEAVAGAGDVNADGIPDVIVGSIWANSGGGQAKVFSGADGTLLHTFNGTGADYLGNAVSGAGDVNADGHADLLVGAWGESSFLGYSGTAYVYSGLDGTVLRKYIGLINHGYFGGSVANMGDVDGDSVPDQLIGELGNDSLGYNTGAVYLYSGATGQLIHSWVGPHGNSRFGNRIASVGDIDGDGLSDCVIAAPFQIPTGTAHVLSSGTGMTLFSLKGYEPDEVFAKSVSGAGDVNADGIPDILVGSDRWYVAGGYTGMARIFSGATGEELQRFSPTTPDGRCGLAVTGVGDWNADGLGDWAVGAPAEGISGYKSGSTYIISGKLQGVLLSTENFGPGDFAVFRVKGGTPLGLAFLAYSFQGGGPSQTPFGEVALTQPFHTLPALDLNLNGDAELVQYLPHSIAGTTIWTQALDFTTGNLSNPNPLRVY